MYKAKARDYDYSVNFCPKSGVWIGRVSEFESIVAHGESESEAFEEIKGVVEFMLQDLAESNEPIPPPLNQCDGCRAGIPIENGLHRMGGMKGTVGGYWNSQTCEKDKYIKEN